ncbi:hypothetical protein KA107_02135 [Candidatus Pacearchaeota archaeon]|nr:hypothetical protein [Candidatus Pacearchaeota archaeon]
MSDAKCVGYLERLAMIIDIPELAIIAPSRPPVRSGRRQGNVVYNSEKMPIVQQGKNLYLLATEPFENLGFEARSAFGDYKAEQGLEPRILMPGGGVISRILKNPNLAVEYDFDKMYESSTKIAVENLKRAHQEGNSIDITDRVL